VKKPRPVAKAPSAPEVAASQAVLQVAEAAAPPADEPLAEAPAAEALVADAAPVDAPPADVPPASQVVETAPSSAASAVPPVADSTTAAASAAADVGAAPLPAVAASGAGDTAPFDWPVSTRLSYRLTGYYRGEVEGEAQVEWVRSGDRYQVHLDVLAGLPVAPLFTRRMSSDGEITAAGLVPRRYDQDTKVAFRDRKRDTLLFEPDGVVLANGQRRDSMAGVQDTASQFVQLSYLFATQPALGRAGASVEFPLAFPRKLERWSYDVLAQETVHAPFGPLETFHLIPRREAGGGDLQVEMWLAPTLRYLPVRIRIRQDAQTYMDLMVKRPPEMAAMP
jgi:Protein of unknown function (DUF3108)